MLITTVLTFFVVRHTWRLPRGLALSATAFFVAIDLLLVADCAMKFFDGGGAPLLGAALLFLLMSTWTRGRQLLVGSLKREGLSLVPFVESLQGLPRVERTAVYPVADAELVPQALLHNLKHNQVLHRRNLVVSLRTAASPWVDESARVEVERLSPDFERVIVQLGFMESPDLPATLSKHLDVPPFECSHFLSRETVVPSPGMAWPPGANACSR